MRRLVPMLLLASCLLAATAARADYNPVGSGRTKIELDKGFLHQLATEGVKLQAVAPARLQGRTLTFPAAGGKFDPVSGNGTVEHEGALIFRAGKRKVPLKALKLRTSQKHAPFSAKVGGSQLKIATAAGLQVARDGFGSKVRMSKLALSSTAAVRLGKKLDRRDLFIPSTPIGAATTITAPETTTLLERGTGTLTFDPGFLAKLQSLHVAVNPIFPAEHQGALFQLPIFTGHLAPDASQGRVETNGSIELLQLGGGQVFWKTPWVDFDSHALNAEVDVEPSPPYAGKAGRLTVASMTANALASADASKRTISLAPVSLGLDPAVADTFNQVFAAPAGSPPVFSGDEPVGSISFTATAE